MISLCTPTRGRPDRFENMVTSARATATGDFEVVAWLDEDDPWRYQYPRFRDVPVRYASGPRVYENGVLTTSGLWTDAWRQAQGDIAMLASDDIEFATPGWDARIESAFAGVEDRILMAYCSDGSKRQLPVAPFVSREWIDAVGYFTPPGWQGWFSDTWVWAIAADLKRVVHFPNVLIEHMRPGRRARSRGDRTYRAGIEARDAVGGHSAMKLRFYSLPEVARRDAARTRLRARMTSDVELVPNPVPDWFTEAVTRSSRSRRNRG
jgi:hypothetical protein